MSTLRPAGLDRDRHADHVHHDPAREHHHDGEEVPVYDRGLAFDIGTLLNRRRILGMIVGAGLLPVVSGGLSPASAALRSIGSCEEIPPETAGPFPGDGSNGPNVLDDVGIVRRNVRRSFGDADGFAEGVPLTLKIRLLEVAKGCEPFVGAALYIWQCDAIGRYSMYAQGIEDENYLRGVQAADRKGDITFKTTFPGMYPGRWPHIHFEVYPNLEEATSWRNKIATSQLAFPRKAARTVYKSDGYGRSLELLEDMSLEEDGVFSDGWKDQLARTRGSVATGFTSTLTVAI